MFKFEHSCCPNKSCHALFHVVSVGQCGFSPSSRLVRGRVRKPLSQGPSVALRPCAAVSACWRTDLKLAWSCWTSAAVVQRVQRAHCRPPAATMQPMMCATGIAHVMVVFDLLARGSPGWMAAGPRSCLLCAAMCAFLRTQRRRAGGTGSNWLADDVMLGGRASAAPALTLRVLRTSAHAGCHLPPLRCWEHNQAAPICTPRDSEGRACLGE